MGRYTFWGILGFILWLGVGCTAHISESELQTMSKMNDGWRELILSLQNNQDEVSKAYQDYQNTLSDTSNYYSKLALKDSSFMAKSGKVTANFRSWYGKCVACIKALEAQIDGNKSWMERLSPEASHLDETRRSWDSRRTQFYGAIDECQMLVLLQMDDYLIDLSSLSRRVKPSQEAVPEN